MVEPGSRVLDLGCGQGDLMNLLAQKKDAKVQGIELNDEAIYKCVEKGLSVFHGDLDSGLSEYPDKSFDYVILNLRHPWPDTKNLGEKYVTQLKAKPNFKLTYQQDDVLVFKRIQSEI